MCTISKEGIRILGAVFLRLRGVDKCNGQTVETAVMAYVSDCTDKFYISRQVMRELGIIPPDFPKITIPIQTAAAGSTGSDFAPCGCPKRTEPLKRPDVLPFSPAEKNVPEMQRWLEERYQSSTFNT